MLVTDRTDATRAAFQSFAKSKGMADLAVPGEVLVVDQVPLLGSGKLDHPAVAKLVRERMEAGDKARAEPAMSV